MKKVILDEIPFKINREQLFRRLRMEDGNEDAQSVLSLAEEAEDIGKPKGMYVESYIDEKGADYVVVNGIAFQSRILRVNLEQAFKVFPFLATCGKELEKWSESLDDMLMRYWADVIKEMVLGSGVIFLLGKLKEDTGLKHVSAMNPGSLEDWPLSEQGKLFAILGDTRKAIGVELTDSCLMLPAKSVSGIWFPSETSFESCQLCSREDCRGRRAPYDGKLYEIRYKTGK